MYNNKSSNHHTQYVRLHTHQSGLWAFKSSVHDNSLCGLPQTMMGRGRRRRHRGSLFLEAGARVLQAEGRKEAKEGERKKGIGNPLNVDVREKDRENLHNPCVCVCVSCPHCRFHLSFRMRRNWLLVLGFMLYHSYHYDNCAACSCCCPYCDSLALPKAGGNLEFCEFAPTCSIFQR